MEELRQKRPRWLEVSLLYLADFLPGFFSQTNLLCLEDFLCYSKIITYVQHGTFSLVLNSQIWANICYFNISNARREHYLDHLYHGPVPTCSTTHFVFLEHLTVSVHDAKHIVYYKYRTLESRCSTLIQRRKHCRRWFYTALLPRRRIWEGEDDRRMVNLLIHGLKNFLCEDPFGGWETCDSKFCGSRKKSVFRIRIGSGFNQVSGSGSVIQILIQECKNDPQK